MYYVRKLFTKKFFLGIGSIGGFILGYLSEENKIILIPTKI